MYWSTLLTLTRPLGLTPTGINIMAVRNASKKAGGGTRNPKASKGQHRSLKVREGDKVLIMNIIATQNKSNWLPGLNVGIKKDLTLIALKEGKLIITCENPDLDPSNPINQQLFPDQIGLKLFKKYAHVIPEPQHVRFKLIDQV